ncbi:MAG TPA: M20/M25/M40 family metallo-hydrolase [Patescibacteria group bacterium]|nr:M20/M25/M40 family metallo-hydrolase [Patescibacteria group bacterium]
MRIRTRTGLCFTLAALVGAAFGLATPPFSATASARAPKHAAAGATRDPQDVAARIVGEEMTTNGAWPKLAWLADRIGPRLSGSPGAAAAVAWTLEEFRRDGLSNVRAEKVMVPHWVRGEESARLVAPYGRRLLVTALGMSVPTPAEGVTAEIVEVDSLDALKTLGDKARGRIVLFSHETTAGREMAGYGATSPLRVKGPSEAARLGAVAALVRSLGTLRARLPHTGTLVYADDAPKIPAAALAEEDALLLHRLLEAGQPVRVHLSLGCVTLPDAESANVVAELRGRERPDEVVVIGGHLDSWDLGDGAIDDGAGVVMAMEALRLLKHLDLVPRRTIRAVLYMNEENGARGGKTYVETHKGEMARHVAAIESDSGADHPLGFRVAAGPGGEAAARALAAPLAAVGAADVKAADEGGVDIGPMKAEGVPLLGLRQDVTHYFDWHHTAADTLDKVEPRALAENAAAMAFMAWALAESPEPLPRVPPAAPPAAPAAPTAPAAAPAVSTKPGAP